MTDFAKVRAILDAATPGPWRHHPHDYPGEQLPWSESVYWSQPRADSVPRVVLARSDAPDARAIVVARNLAPALLAVAEAAEAYSPQNLHDWRCERRTKEVGWKNGDPPVIECECGYDELEAALDALHAKMKEVQP